jgi:3-oxoacyl-[acyl-carrier protein] reductase
MGRGIGQAFAELGANIAILDINTDVGEREAEKIQGLGVECFCLYCDVTDLKSLKNAAEETYKRFSHIDVMVNNAGVTRPGKLLDMDEEISGFYDVVNIDLHGMVNSTYFFGKRMRDAGRGGSIISITSICGQITPGSFYTSGYNVSKAGIDHFTRTMAVELAPHNIRVNAVAPGFTHTNFPMPPEMEATRNSKTPLGRMGEPIEVGAMCVYLASPAANQITGGVYLIDGGYAINHH